MRSSVVLFIMLFILTAAWRGYAQEDKPELQVEPVNYSLDLTIDYDSGTVSGRCAITLLNSSDSLAFAAPIILYRLLDVKSVQDAAGNKMSFRQAIVPMRNWEQIKVNAVEMELPEALKPGERQTFCIQYTGQVRGYSEDGWNYVKESIDRNFTMFRLDGFSYPVVSNPDAIQLLQLIRHKFDYTVSVTVPRGLEVANGGRLVDKIPLGASDKFIYQSLAPSYRMDITVSDYAILSRGGNKIYYFKDDERGAGFFMAAMEKSLSMYRDWFGPLNVFRGISIIEIPEDYGAQADVATITITADGFRKADNAATIYHEISHLWNVTPLDISPSRLESEGLAMFLQSLLREKFDGAQNEVQNEVESYRINFRRSVQDHPEYLTVPIKEYGSNGLTDLSYSNGMIFFAVLYELVGGDKFKEIIRNYYADYCRTGAALEDFMATCGKTAKINLNCFFEDWLLSADYTGYITGNLSFEEIADLYR